MPGNRKSWLRIRGEWLLIIFLVISPFYPAPGSEDLAPVRAAALRRVYLPAITNSNSAPAVQINASASSGTAPLSIRFDAAAGPAGSQWTGYQWDFGDGNTASGGSAGHEYTQPGEYRVTLTVTNSQGARSATSMTVKVNEPALYAKNVILFIGDGMGFEHVKAGGLYLNGAAGTLPFEAFPHKGKMTNRSADSSVTDSAAAATAMATGRKVNNQIVSMAVPGDGGELYTILEYARDQGLSTGLVTTTTITHATPSAFGAHSKARNDHEDIASDLVNQTRPNVLMGGGGAGMAVEEAAGAGYQVLPDSSTLLGLNTESLAPDAMRISGLFGTADIPYEMDGLTYQPHLSQMTMTALNLLDNDPDGFFLMVEGGRIDHASHSNLERQMVGEMAEFARTVEAAVEWAKTHPDTLIVVVADHETGGLKVVRGNGQGQVPTVTWDRTSHTGVNIPVYINGTYQGELPSVIDNTQIPEIISGGKFPGN